jgi:uncharacterized protein (UPF0218 family)
MIVRYTLVFYTLFFVILDQKSQRVQRVVARRTVRRGTVVVASSPSCIYTIPKIAPAVKKKMQAVEKKYLVITGC